jgi:5-dehydro-2-deoxygluconokinase
VGDDTVARALAEVYDQGIKPDWWKLEAQASPTAWSAIDAVIDARDPFCRGVVLLGLDAPQRELEAAFEIARSSHNVRGFAVGRTIFADAARKWLAGEIRDEEAVADMAGRFGALVQVWERLEASAAA